MNNFYSVTGSFSIISFLVVLVISPVLASAEQEHSMPNLLNDLDENLVLPAETIPKKKYRLRLTSNASSLYDSGLYQLKIDYINLDRNGNNPIPDLKLIFSFRYKSETPQNTTFYNDSQYNILESFGNQMNKQDGSFFISIGKSW